MICSIYLPSTNSTMGDFCQSLEELKHFCLKESFSDLIIMGDFNAHITGERSSRPSNSRGKLVQQLLSNLNLIAVNLKPVCKGPVETYECSTAVSTIDYICVPNTLFQSISNAEVLDIHPENATHHLPVTVTLDIMSSSPEQLTNYAQTLRIAWKKCTSDNIEMFQNELNRKLDSLDGPLLHTSDSIDAYAKELTDCMVNASVVLPHISYKSYIKPYWNNKLKTLRKEVNRKYIKWTKDGRPRGRHNQTYAEYKEAKRLFRREQRRCIQEYSMREYANMSSTLEQDQNRFWKLLNLTKKNKRSDVNLEIGDEMVHDQHKITGLWANYFEDLHEFKRYENENIFDSGFLKDIESEIHRLDLLEDESDTVLAQPFTLYEVNQVIYDLPNGKSPGFDKICYEHVKYGGPNLLHHIVLLFNAIVCVEYISLSFKLAVKVPFPKDITGKKTFDNHRGISLMPVLDKILQKLVLNRILAVPDCKIHRLQGAYQTEQSALTTAFMIDESIRDCCENKDRVYTCFVDISKAFDRMWIDAMLYKLYHHMGITGKTWRIIKNWYTNMKEIICVNGLYSRDKELKSTESLANFKKSVKALQL